MKLATTLLLSAMSFSAWSATSNNPLSVHVLNQQTGLPSQGVVVELDKKEGDNWKQLAEAKTDGDGRIGALYPQGQTMEKGIYKVTFRTGNYFAQQKQSTFFPEVPVIFEVKQDNQHLHIPLLLSQYGYSTYRGS